MKKIMSVSIEEGVLGLAKDAAYEARVSLSAWVEEAIRMRMKEPYLIKEVSEALRVEKKPESVKGLNYHKQSFKSYSKDAQLGKKS